jgi:HK97 gp10 family phage protein
MPELEFTVHGMAELHDFLQRLPERVERNILRGMIRAASKPARDRARELAPRLKDDDPRRVPGALAASVRIMSTLLKGGVVKGGVAAGSMKRTAGSAKDAFYAHFLEYGAAHTPAQPFMRPAADATTAAALALAAAYVQERLAAGDLKR